MRKTTALGDIPCLPSNRLHTYQAESENQRIECEAPLKRQSAIPPIPVTACNSTDRPKPIGGLTAGDQKTPDTGSTCQQHRDGLQEVWYTTEDLARMLGVDPSTLRRWRTARPPQGPPFVQISSRMTLYSAHDVRQWLDSRRIDPAQAA